MDEVMEFSHPADMKPSHSNDWRNNQGLQLVRNEWNPERYERIQFAESFAPNSTVSEQGRIITDDDRKLFTECMHECFSEMTYSRLPFVFGARSTEESMTFGGGTCASWNEVLWNKLDQKGWHSHMVAATLPSKCRRAYTPRYTLGHSALVVEGCGNFAVLDPTLRITEPVIVPFDGDIECTSPLIGNLRFNLDRRNQCINAYIVENLDAGPEFSYFLRPVLNPWQSITIPMTEAQQMIPIVKWSPEGQQVQKLLIDVRKMEISKKAEGQDLGPNSENRVSLAFCDAPAQLDTFLDEEFWSTLGFSDPAKASEMKDYVMQVCNACLSPPVRLERSRSRM